MTGATSKCICGVQPPENDLTTIFVCYFLHVRSSVPNDHHHERNNDDLLHSDEENHCNYDRDHSHKGLGYPKEFDLWVYCTASVPTTMQHLHFDFEYFPRHGLGRTQGDWPLVQDE